MTTTEFFATHPVFSLDDAVRALAPESARLTVVERLKHHLEVGRLQLVTREIYAVVPPSSRAATFQPDPFLVASAVRPDGIYSYHSALELLGVAHSTWTQLTLCTERRRRPLRMKGATLRFLEVPTPFRSGGTKDLGTRQAERQGRLLRTTGPERTLVEGFHRPGLAGGLEELVLSVGEVPLLDLDLLCEVLERYSIRKLWAATGWFLESHRTMFQVPDALLGRFEKKRPASPHYLDRNSRGGSLSSRWNVVVPEALGRVGGPDES
ncbi:MAG: type IV toxin-antitoxin system AbiEi family antitoxin domain-containing protein [Acidobacteriota bacterium]